MKNTKEHIILIGAGGHCKSCIDVIEKEDKYKIIGILDDDKNKLNTFVLGYQIIGNTKEIKTFQKQCNNFLITIGQIKSAEIRVRIYSQLKELNATLPVIISPLAYVSKHATIKEGAIIMHHVLINANSTINENCIINTKALVEHDSEIGAHCHISTGSIVNGTVNIGSKSFVGSGATLVNNISITDETIIASGTVVFKDINKKGTYAGIPDKQIN